MFIVELATYMSRVLDLSRALTVFLRVLRFSSLRKLIDLAKLDVLRGETW